MHVTATIIKLTAAAINQRAWTERGRGLRGQIGPNVIDIVSLGKLFYCTVAFF